LKGYVGTGQFSDVNDSVNVVNEIAQHSLGNYFPVFVGCDSNLCFISNLYYYLLLRVPYALCSKIINLL